MRLKRALLNVVVLCVTLVVGLLLGEAGARLILNPADFLSVTTVRDDVLGTRSPARKEIGQTPRWSARDCTRHDCVARTLTGQRCPVSVVRAAFGTCNERGAKLRRGRTKG